MLQMIFVTNFALYLFTQNDSVSGIVENVASRRILTKMAASVLHRIKSNIFFFFASINHQYMDIYHTKKQAENSPRSCSYLLLKTLFYFMSQCTSVPYFQRGLCKLDKELDNCNFTFIKKRNRPFKESNYKVCKYNTLGYTGLFSLHIEPPSYLSYKQVQWIKHDYSLHKQ